MTTDKTSNPKVAALAVGGIAVLFLIKWARLGQSDPALLWATAGFLLVMPYAYYQSQSVGNFSRAPAWASTLIVIGLIATVGSFVVLSA